MRPTHYEALERSFAAQKVNFDRRFAEIRSKITGPLVLKRDMLRLDEITKNVCLNGEQYIPNFKASLAIEIEQTLCNFWLSGKRVFNVSTNLTHQLLNTDLKFQKRYLKVPFRCFLLRFEEAPIELECPDGSRARLDGCYVTHMMDSANSESRMTQEQREKVFKGLIAEEEPDPGLFESREILKFMFYSDLIKGPDGRPRGNAAANWFELDVLADDFVVTDAFFEKREKQIIDDPRNDHSLLTRLALNTILYITSIGADLAPTTSRGKRLLERASKQTNNNQRQRFLEEAKGHTMIDFIDVGRRAKKPAGQPSEERTGKTWSLSYKLLVRGHWRGYWKLKENLTEEERPFVIAEEGREVLFRKFVEPFERGRDLAEALPKEYRVV